MRTITIAMAVLFLMPGCGGDDEGGNGFEGMYKMVLHQDKQSCDESEEWQDKETQSPYFMLKQENLLGNSLLGWYDCENESPESCEETP